MHSVYVLIGKKTGRRYVGCTSKSVEERMLWHEQSTTSWTRKNIPFKLVYVEKFSEKSAALKREKYFKTGQGRRTLDTILARKS